MDFFEVIALSSSQLLVAFSLAIFAALILASIYIRIKAQYRGRNKLPDHTKRRVFGVGRTREPTLGEIPTENHEVVSGARPKEHSKQGEGFLNFDVPVEPATNGTVADTPSNANGSDAGIDQNEHETEAVVGATATPQATDTTQHEYEDQFENGRAAHSEVRWEENGDSQDYGVARNDSIDTQDVTATWDEPYDGDLDLDDEVQETVDNDSDATDDVSEFGTNYESADYQNADEYVDTFAQGREDEYDAANEYQTDGELATATYDDQELEQSTEPEVDETVVPFDHRTVEAKRVDTTNYTDLNFAVVSVCLISVEHGQIYRDIQGKNLGRFLTQRGFIFLDEEYHLQNKSMVEKGAIRVRNFEATLIGDLVRGNETTRGFRLYFKPSDCIDPLATLNEMLKVAQSAIGFFSSEVSSKPLAIYDGRKDGHGNISPLTQEDYDTLKRELSAVFPHYLDDTSKRITVSGSDYTPSDDLPTRAERI